MRLADNVVNMRERLAARELVHMRVDEIRWVAAIGQHNFCGGGATFFFVRMQSLRARLGLPHLRQLVEAQALVLRGATPLPKRLDARAY